LLPLLSPSDGVTMDAEPSMCVVVVGAVTLEFLLVS
jgi:hypothetical protein